MAQRPPRDLDWVPDDNTGITVPSQTKQNAGWLVEKPARQFFNWLWNRLSRWTHYFSGQSQEFIVIDSTNTNEKDYDTLAAYIADSPAAGDKVLVKETQVLTAQMIIPSGITLRLLDGITFTRSTNEANSVIKFGSDIIIEGVLNLVLSQTGTTAKAVEFDGDNIVGRVNVENSSTGTLTTAYHINASKTGNSVRGFAQNTGGGTLTNILVDSSAEDTNLLEIVDEPSSAIARALGKNTLFNGFKFKLGSDADGDIYYRNAGILKRLPKGTDGQVLRLTAGLPSWETQPFVKIIDIGDWNMNTTAVKAVAHGLTPSKIKGVEVMIRNDAGAASALLASSATINGTVDGVWGVGTTGGTDVSMERVSGGDYHSASYQATSFNRGFIKITYEP